MAISIVQTYTTALTGSTTPVSGTPFASNITAGSTIALAVSWASASNSVTSITDNLNSGSYTAIASSFEQAQVRTLQWFYMPNSAAGALTVTVNTTSAPSSEVVKAYEIGGLGASPVTDGAVVANNAGTTSFTIGSLTTTNANDILLVMFRGQTASAISAGWTWPFSGSGTAVAYQIVSSTGAYSATLTQSTGTVNGSMVAFKQGGSSGSLTATWSAPNAVTGYKVSYGTTSGGPYGTTVDVGNVLTKTITGLTSGTTYYFIVKAYDASSNLSCATAEASAMA